MNAGVRKVKEESQHVRERCVEDCLSINISAAEPWINNSASESRCVPLC